MINVCKKAVLCVVFLVFGVSLGSMTCFAFDLPGSDLSIDTQFHGRIESMGVLRDTNGFQYGFYDQSQWVQWLNQIKFDLDVRPVYKEKPSFRLEKVFFSYFASWDAIFSVSNHFDKIRQTGPARNEFGKDDLRSEKDLREVFADVVAESGDQYLNLRLGRQIVQWGESDGFNLMNVVNPSDNKNAMFFTAPEDIAVPLWMARMDYSVKAVGPFSSLSLQLLGIPDVRPNTFAPLDGNYAAPYAFPFAGLAGSGMVIHEDMPDNMEYGARLGANLSGLQLYLYYFHGYQYGGSLDNTSFVLENGGSAMTFRHLKQDVYGFSFNTFIPYVGGILRGEGSLTDKSSFTDYSVDRGFTQHTYYQALIGFDKDLHPKWTGTDSSLGFGCQIYYAHIDNWEDHDALRPSDAKDSMRFTTILYTDYLNGRLTPQIFVMYDPRGTWMTNAQLGFTPDGRWYMQIAQISFWGRTASTSPFSGMIGTSEMSFKIGYRW